jgi:hypothetical protein
MLFLNEHGYDVERERAREHFIIGQPYTVKKFNLGGYSSSIEFVGVSGSWNSVMFAAAPKQGEAK